MRSYQTLTVNSDPRGLLTVRLNRPDIRNAFNEAMIQELTELFTSVAQDSAIRLVVLRGEGKVFCAGGDLNWMRRSVEVSYEENLKDTLALTHLFKKMNECPKPLIAAVQGAAIGGGVGMISVCDIVIAARETEFSLSEVRLGIVPACIGPFVISKIGASQSRALFISAERFRSEKALQIGLIHQVVESAADLDSAVTQLTDRMLDCGPQAMSLAKQLVLDLAWPERRSVMRDCYTHVAELLARVRISPEGQEGLKAFLEKRAPAWIQKKGPKT